LALPDSLPAADPARGLTIFDDRRAIPREALALLPALHREAGRDLHLWRFLASAPLFCTALMATGAAVLAWNSLAAEGELASHFVWAVAVLAGVIAVTRSHILGFSKSPRPTPLAAMARELRLLLLFVGLAWGLGAFLVLPQSPVLALVFAAAPALIASLILKDEDGAIIFGTPVSFLTAASVLWRDGPSRPWTAAAVLAGIAGLSMLHCVISRRRAGR